MKNILGFGLVLGFALGISPISASLAQAAAPAAKAKAPTPVAATPAASASSGEDWKGKTDGSEVHLGGLTGLGIIDFHPGFVLLGTASKKIVHSGFVPDITNSVSIEAEAGPLFISGATLFDYSLHLRWDFEKDEHWTFYAIGGVGGFIASSSSGLGTNNFMLFPRTGLGTFYRVNDLILIRGEVSHELIAAGVTVPLYFGSGQ